MAKSRDDGEQSKDLDVDTDFPRSERWRLCTDEWQQPFGPANFSQEYFVGMDEGLALVASYLKANKKVAAKELEVLHDTSFGAITTDKVQPLGFRKDRLGRLLGVHIPGVGTEYSASISAQGYKNFLHAIKVANGEWETHDDLGKYFFTVKIKKTVYEYTPFLNGIIREHITGKTVLKETEEDELLEYLKRSGIADDSVSVKMTIRAIDVVETVEQAFAEFEKSAAMSEEAKDEKSIIKSVIELITKLHRNHGFCDGNGRANIFLLMHYYLLKFFNTRAIIQTPAHFFGYSETELVDEIERGRKKFEAYKITKAKEYFFPLLKEEGEIKPEEVKKALIDKLAAQPLVALAQINELYLQLLKKRRDEKFIEPTDQASVNSQGVFSTRDMRLQQLLVLLRNVYYEVVEKQIAKQAGVFKPKLNDHDWVVSQQAFKDIMAKHESILQDESIVGSAVYGKVSLQQAVHAVVEKELKTVEFDPSTQEDLSECDEMLAQEQASQKRRGMR